MSLAGTEAELQGILDDVAFTRAYGFRLHTIDEGRCTLAVPFQAAFERPGGIVSGQVLMAAADVAMGLAVLERARPRGGPGAGRRGARLPRVPPPKACARPRAP